MPRLKQPKKIVTFTAAEVWEALRTKYPEIGMPAEYDVTEQGDDASEMAAGDVDGDVDINDIAFSFDSLSEGIAVSFIPGHKPKQER